MQLLAHLLQFLAHTINEVICLASKKLNDKQKRFCREYLIDLNATQAAKRSGYSKKTAGSIGSENLLKPEIIEQLNKLMDKRAEKVEVSANDVLSSIKEIRARCMQSAPVLVTIKGKQKQPTEEIQAPDGKIISAGIWKFDATNALKANEMIGKHLQMFTDKIDITGTINVNNSDLTESDLNKKLNEMKKRIINRG